MLNNTAPYRRDDHGSLKVPVVMPLIEVVINDDGYLDIRLDREPYAPEGAVTRRELGSIVESVATDLGAPVRVEVHESDGTTYTDIVMPDGRASGQTAAGQVPEASPSAFLPDEEVSIAVILGRHQRGGDSLESRLPPVLLAAHRGHVVLLGRTSGTVRVIGE
ncbi:hypothetical protein [Nocardioides sp.]|uniref:hypothetical protein n=1 Tax=Nocardioides sp. TaxID=35761 RepID=UPI00262E894D|nr:hypothetical protein [Nocardioides sp.]MDI6910466.1 hypothetical protein [Nocardioides sp.]